MAREAISIHTARAGGDVEEVVKDARKHHISIHTARAGGDIVLSIKNINILVFQSTPPVRAVTSLQPA